MSIIRQMICSKEEELQAEYEYHLAMWTNADLHCCLYPKEECWKEDLKKFSKALKRTVRKMEKHARAVSL